VFFKNLQSKVNTNNPERLDESFAENMKQMQMHHDRDEKISYIGNNSRDEKNKPFFVEILKHNKVNEESADKMKQHPHNLKGEFIWFGIEYFKNRISEKESKRRMGNVIIITGVILQTRIIRDGFVAFIFPGLYRAEIAFGNTSLKKILQRSEQNDITLLNTGNFISNIRIPYIKSNQKKEQQYNQRICKSSNFAYHCDVK
jgi:hypothetical protein